MRRALAALLLALAASCAQAFIGVDSTHTGGIATTRSTGPGAATITSTPTGAKVSGLVHVASPTGTTAPVRMASHVSKVGVGMMAGRAVAALLGSPVTWVAVAAWDLYRQVRVRPDGQGGLARDAGTLPVQAQAYCLVLPNSVEKCASSPGGAVAYLVNYYNSTNHEDVLGSGHDAVFQLGYCDAVGCFIGITRYTNGVITTPYNAYGGKIDPTVKTGPICPPYSGQFAEVYSEAPDADGKCWGGQVQPITADQAAAVAAAIANIDWAAIMRDVTGRDPAAPWPAGQVQHEFEPPSVDVPVPTVPGTTTTTENGSGSVTSATEFRLSDILPRNGAGAQGRWQTTTTTTTRDINGNPIGDPTTVTTGGDTPEIRTEDPCKANPDRVGCMDAGEVEEAELQQQDRNITVTPATGFGPGTAACPAPRHINTIAGVSLDIPFDQACDFFSALRPFILAATALGCGFILLGLRQGDGS